MYPKKAGVYKLTCKINNKIYIGKSVDIRDRIRCHRKSETQGKASSMIIKAIRKHGWENFEVAILCILEDFEKEEKHNTELLDLESSYIEEYKSTDKDIGYNIIKYGKDRTGVPHTLETKQKLREARLGKTHSNETKKLLSEKFSGENHPMWGKHYSEEIIAKRSGKNSPHYGKKGKLHSWYGCKHTEEARKKIKEKRKTQDMTPFIKKVKQIDLNSGECIKIWDCVKDAAQHYNVNVSSIREVCLKRKKGNHISRKCRGYGWEYVIRNH